MKKRILFLVAALALLLSACGGKQPAPEPESATKRETVALTVWGAEEDEALLREIFASFQARYAGEADFQLP